MHYSTLLSLLPLVARQSAAHPANAPRDVGSAGDWDAAYQKARAMVDRMTLEEKVSLASGSDGQNGCAGNIAAIPRLNFPGMCLCDAGQGIRATDGASGFPSGIHVGASWNKDLARQQAAAMGREFKRKGVNVILGPVIGPAWTIVRGGRNWEGPSADPYLAGSIAAEVIRGVQSANVITSTKHFIGNEQEYQRSPENGNQAVSTVIDDKAMHELFLWPFQDAVRAGSSNIMCSYQRLNGTYGCGHDRALNGLLKGELGFKGFVLSDWGALYGGLEYATSGLDVGMPIAWSWGKTLVEAVQRGSFPESRITDMALRIIAAWYLVGQDQGFPQPGSGVPKKVHEAHDVVDAREPRDRPTLLQGAVEGHVLVKNEGDVLPLRSPRTVSVFGYSANTAAKYSLAEDTDGSWSWGGAPVLGVSGPRLYAPKGTLYSGGGAGAISPAAVTSPLEALQARAARAGAGGFRLLQDLTSARPRVDPASDACLVFGNAWASEGAERAGLADDYTDTLVRAVADQCANTVVVLHNAGVRVVDGFVDHPNVKALVFAHLPGQESGHALVSLLWGDAAPSGKLPYTVARREADYGPRLEHVTGGVDTYADGVYTDYKYFEARGIEPRYEFGFGLSYTRFDYAALAVDRRGSASEWPSGRVVPGGQEDLFDTVATVSFALTNAGARDGAEAAQLYVRIPGVRAKQLRGFAKRSLRRGETARLSLDLTRRDLSVWNTQAQRWQLQRGRYEILVGASSRQLPLVTTLTI